MKKILPNKVLPAARRGFTLIELLIVMAIIGILASIGLVSFRSSQAKARDAQRKSDLSQMQRALEAYFNDKGEYPEVDSLPLAGDEWIDTDVDDGTLYMKSFPADPKSYTYLYERPTTTSYEIYAYLENLSDGSITACVVDSGKDCSAPGDCNYGVASGNLNICN
ncbi:type II secretion system GspH family protein [Patescibacteria group bacterium]|nr:type II secretion system GspH family protein [Patescibacteria group bacterium]